VQASRCLTIVGTTGRGAVPATLCLRAATAEEATPQRRPLLLLLLLLLGSSCRLQPMHASVLGFIFRYTRRTTISLLSAPFSAGVSVCRDIWSSPL